MICCMAVSCFVAVLKTKTTQHSTAVAMVLYREGVVLVAGNGESNSVVYILVS